jgi:hypothetical protein
MARQRLAFFILSLFILDIELHAATPPAHAGGERISFGLSFYAASHPASTDDSPCGIPGHCCGASHHDHFASVLSRAHLPILLAVIAVYEWGLVIAPPHPKPPAKSIRAPPSVA